MIKRNRKKTQPKKKGGISQSLFFFFFFFFFFVKVIFGSAPSYSKSLIVSGIFALFGAFISGVFILREHFVSEVDEKEKKECGFSHDKMDFVIIAAISFIIAVTSGILLFFIIHLTFFHTVIRPGILAAWISVVIAAQDLYAISWIRKKITNDVLENMDKIITLLKNDAIFSALVAIAVVWSRNGWNAADNVLAIGGAFYIIGYSVYFLTSSVKGIMDASCDPVTVSNISKYIKKADSSLRIKDLKVNKPGRRIEIMAVITVSKKLKVIDANRISFKIKYALQRGLSVPHEVYVGFEGK